MQVFSTFENTDFLEIAISRLEKSGIVKENIFAVPLDNRSDEKSIIDTIHHSDGISIIDLGAALATAFAVIGASIGFMLAWGPIYWGIIGASIGLLLGIGIKLFIYKVIKKEKRHSQGKQAEVILIIECDEKEAGMVQNILWEQYALGVARVR
ncbi:MAG: hypothetical protein Q8935_13810 [Bacillota bacterium]|nr:hypothetical protein [Bacillota bacterium]